MNQKPLLPIKNNNNNNNLEASNVALASQRLDHLCFRGQIVKPNKICGAT